MKARIITIVIISASLLADAARAEIVNFDDAKVGEVPSGWIGTKTGKGEAKWTVVADETAPSKPNVLKQSGEATYLFRSDEDAVARAATPTDSVRQSG